MLQTYAQYAAHVLRKLRSLMRRPATYRRPCSESGHTRFPKTFGSTQGRLKPHNADGSQSHYTAELLPLLCNEKLYGVAADILQSEYLQARDGSVGISLKDGGAEGLIQKLQLRLVPDQDLSLKQIPSPTPRDGLVVSVTPRQ